MYTIRARGVARVWPIDDAAPGIWPASDAYRLPAFNDNAPNVLCYSHRGNSCVKHRKGAWARFVASHLLCHLILHFSAGSQPLRIPGGIINLAFTGKKHPSRKGFEGNSKRPDGSKSRGKAPAPSVHLRCMAYAPHRPITRH